MQAAETEQLIQLNAMVIAGEIMSPEQTSLHEFLKQKDLNLSRLLVLEEEADLLAVENERLRNLLFEHGIDPVTLGSVAPRPPSSQPTKVTVETLLIEGDGSFSNSPQVVLKDACGNMNALCVAYCRAGCVENAVICGGVDKMLRVYDFSEPENPQTLCQYGLSAPILSVASFNSLVACSLMDGGVAVVDPSALCAGLGDAAVWKDKPHSKYVVNVAWSPCGSLLLTCSQDKSVALHRPRSDPLRMELVTHLRFAETPECAVFVPSGSVPANWTDDGSAGDPFLVVALRGVPYLLYINSRTLEQHRVSLNEHDWDEHVSFTVLHLALSPCGRFLAAATDKDMHVIYRCGSHERVQVLAGGHSSDAYGRPKVAWDRTSCYVYCNSQSDHNLCVYSLCSGRVATSLRHHTGQIRDIFCSPKDRNVLTASYDHTVVEWVHRLSPC